MNEGLDTKGRLHPSSALGRLLTHIRLGPKPLNLWHAADEAVERADEETVRCALRGLLGLHLHELSYTEPRVAMRNVREGDYVRLHGTASYVERVIARKAVVTLKARLHTPDGPERTHAYDRDVRIPLVARAREER